MSRLKSLAAAAATTLSLIAGAAWAHHSGHEVTTLERCQMLPGNATVGHRAACIACLSSPSPQHYHPEYPEGARCRPNGSHR
ncbi:MAG: hypothetical protein U0325_36055 [Polyangiales bacterium]